MAPCVMCKYLGKIRKLQKIYSGLWANITFGPTFQLSNILKVSQKMKVEIY